MKIDATNVHFQTLNEMIKQSEDTDIIIENCTGQRYIGAGLSHKNIVINGVPGNALAAYMDDSIIRVRGNAQDATGDTMNEGRVYIHGSSGDATGYGMRGGKIFIKGRTGYRAGIHMKAYEDNIPVLVIGGVAGSFLGEYQAGGRIIVLGLDAGDEPIAGHFCATGMHGGQIFLCCDELDIDLPNQVVCNKATKEDLKTIEKDIEEFCEEFDCEKDEILAKNFYVLTANTKNPYKQLYTAL